ncbi:hypothetical protein CPHO_10095 [Corynebacterium phocae]|uniref:Lipoprotein n=1 Tax=Corynebacterium phocae TaxID=161895 RepID=A0A1L7D5H2_9CORY|nr:hypothetical protein [Corynebacterium phocae]APT93182.1 hypothetical protein CPHO_10095 [Corynebacterium phocae]KAA8721917.1 hypothetical protein F4V58_09570 [Corynebacterium phocae]
MKRLFPLLALPLVACTGPQAVSSSQMVATLDEHARTEVSTTVDEFLGEGWEEVRIDCTDGANGFEAKGEQGKIQEMPMAAWQMDVCTHELPQGWLDANTRLLFKKNGGWELVEVIER